MKSRFGLEKFKDCDLSFLKDLVFRVHRKMETLILSAMIDSHRKAIIGTPFSHVHVHVCIMSSVSSQCDSTLASSLYPSPI